MLELFGIHASPLVNEVFFVLLGVAFVVEVVWLAVRANPERKWNEIVRELNAEAVAKRPTCDKCHGSGRFPNELFLCGRCNGTGKMIPEKYR